MAGRKRKARARRSIFKDNSSMFLEYAKQLGLSFAARSRINVGGDANGGKEGNPFALD